MLVDDDEGVREIAASALQRAGYRVVPAANAAEALRLYEQHPNIDLLLTDSEMPDISGRVLAERLVARQPALKVLFMSGAVLDHALRDHIDAGRVRFLQKPFAVRDLLAAVREALQNPSQPPPKG